jgi:RNA polymerase sigma-70 factor (ECF subfamily)
MSSDASASGEQLLCRLREKDPATLGRIVEDNARPLFRMSRSMGFDPHESEDLVQDVFTTFLETIDRFEGRSQVRTWLFGILHFKMRERRRALQREEMTDPIDAEFDGMFTPYGHWARPIEDLERLLESSEIGRLLEECLSQLPLQQREVFLLREMEDVESSEVCNNLQITNTHLGVLIHRARHRLRKCMKARGMR